MFAVRLRLTGRAGPARCRRPGFSLAELMIALLILGFGLLIVGAALPIGLTYTRDSIDMATGEAASKYALDEIERGVRTFDELLPSGPNSFRRDSIFRPRSGAKLSVSDTLALAHEPLLKVRPLVARQIDATPGNNYGRTTSSNFVLADRGEELIRTWLGAVGAPTTLLEVDFAANNARALLQNPGFSALASAYPPVSTDARLNTKGFFQNPYAVRPVSEPGGALRGSETLKALERRVSWVGFYRRASYAPGSDPLLYEFVAVAVRKPGEGFRYAVQDETKALTVQGTVTADGGAGGSDDTGGNDRYASGAGPGDESGDSAYSKGDGTNDDSGDSFGETSDDGGDFGAPVSAAFATRAAASNLDFANPSPWLVLFKKLPAVPLGLFDQTAQNKDRAITGVDARAPLEFIASRSVGALLPRGSVLIPARNDQLAFDPFDPKYADNRVKVGFVPHAPEALPIYEVLDNVLTGADEVKIVVKYNGFYPVVAGVPQGTAPSGTAAAQFPFWVIPPAFKDRTSKGEPIFERRNPIVSVARRYVRIPEVP